MSINWQRWDNESLEHKRNRERRRSWHGRQQTVFNVLTDACPSALWHALKALAQLDWKWVHTWTVTATLVQWHGLAMAFGPEQAYDKHLARLNAEFKPHGIEPLT